jgi:hypothetical protein
MPGQGILLEPGNGFIVQTGEIIVRLVVLADMLEAEIQVLSLETAAHGRPMGGGLVAIVPLAFRDYRLGLGRSLASPDAYAVEIF